MRSNHLRVLAGLGALALVAACGSNDDNKKNNNAGATPSANAASYSVEVDANRADLNLPATEFSLAYYPRALSVHPGDTVTFSLNDSGEPHTVVLGTLANQVGAAFDALPPAGKQAAAAVPVVEQTLQKAKLPRLIPVGPGDAFQGGAQPCYQATGIPPEKTACAVHSGDFTGTETDVSSGWLDANAPWSLKISDSAKPGQYHFFCQLHGPAMGGVLTVADKGTTIPAPGDVRTAGDTQLKADTAKLAGAAAQLGKLTASTASAGMFSQALPFGAVAAFGPSNVKIPVGGTVKWTIQGPHVLYFNAPADAQQFRVAAPDGSVHVNPKAAAPVGGPPAPPEPAAVNGGSWNGVGAHSSGAMISFPPKLYTYKLTFTKAGTYNFLCTFHVNMKGTVTVG